MIIVLSLVVCFFKQKTAYEMRISDWSSDVCSSDLFHALYQAVYTFCAVDLSAFYFDVRKDVLYCDRPDSLRRRACRTVLAELFSCLTAWLATILCFPAEEAWWTPGPGKKASVPLLTFPAVPAERLDPALATPWPTMHEAPGGGT